MGAVRSRVDLSGEWHMKYGDIESTVTLPGTTETNAVGPLAGNTGETTHLSRLRPIEGRVTYSREIDIPKSWRGRSVTLFLERTKPSRVFIDGVPVGECRNISTPQRFDLTDRVTVGKHTIAIVVDNTREAVPHQIVESSHAYTDDTQTNWNGIIGSLYLECVDALRISDLRIDSDSIYISTTGKARVSLSVDDCRVADLVVDGHRAVPYDSSQIGRWSEFHPSTHCLRAELMDEDLKGKGKVGKDKLCKDMVEKVFGLCDFKAGGTHFTVNGNPTFLRGKHDACVFPLTGHTPMDLEGWRSYLSVCKEYGINHVRFHSWCPPDAAFTAADELGVYLQPELPFWGDFNADDAELMDFLHGEGENIIREYGHHPSFVMMALGNELWGSVEMMAKFVEDFRGIDPTILYTFGSNYYLGYKGAVDGMDYFTTCRNGGEAWGDYNTHTRGSFSFADALDGGIINHFLPNSVMTLDEGVEGCPVPVISHETGQFQTYPDYAEMEKYSGVLAPYNLGVFKKRLENAGMGNMADAFHKASGAWSVQLYKADIELDMRTRNLAGYQLLDIQDYPGQGSAYVGILDAFMESKNITTPAEWRQWCAPVVPLAALPKFCYADNERLSGDLLLSNYTEKRLNGVSMTADLDGIVKRFTICTDTIGLSTVGSLDFDLSGIAAPRKMTLKVAVDSTEYSNSYPIWVYPAECVPDTVGVLVANRLTEDVAKRLEDGATVLLMPEEGEYAANCVDALFMTDYWNYRMFKTICENNGKPVSPGTLGLLTDPEHPVFNAFPTDMHTSWQWFEVVKKSRPMILDSFPEGYTPLVRVIDNVERNHKLGLMFELAVGRGKLMVVMSPLNRLQRIESRWLYRSVLDYMRSPAFHPTTVVTLTQLDALLNAKAADTAIDDLHNISY
jgi:hypothetical protein